MNEQIEFYLDIIREEIDEDMWYDTSDIIDVTFYKFNKAKYHFSNIKKIVLNSTTFEGEFDEIYYEMESFLVALRSNVDIIMQLLNTSLGLGLEAKDVSLYQVSQHPRLPNRVKNVLYKFTSNRDSEIWEFIYSVRNEIVHANSIKEVHPVMIKNLEAELVVATLIIKGREKDMLNFFTACLSFIERMITRILESVSFTLKNTN